MALIDDADLDVTFAALASSTRRRILIRLTEGEATVNELAEPFDLALPAVSKHLKVLERAGLVTRTRNMQYRPCRLNPAPLEAASEWATQCREAWEGRLDRMTDYLDRMHSPTNGGSEDA
jgi:DNA-binding transcriptional ArsR family regulator